MDIYELQKINDKLSFLDEDKQENLIAQINDISFNKDLTKKEKEKRVNELIQSYI